MCIAIIHCVAKKSATQAPTIILTVLARFQQLLLSKYATERRFNFLPQLQLSVRALPGETFKTVKSHSWG